MWLTDLITFQSVVVTNNYGSISDTWSDTTDTVLCDVQDISKEQLTKDYGITDVGEYKQVFDQTNDPNWETGTRVSFDSVSYQVVLINNYDKIGTSNHTFVILKRVV